MTTVKGDEFAGMSQEELWENLCPKHAVWSQQMMTTMWPYASNRGTWNQRSKVTLPLQNYVCFSPLTSGLESFGHKSTSS